MKWALALAALLVLPLSVTAMVARERGFVVHGPGGDYGIIEQRYCMGESTHVLLGPISYDLPCGFAGLGFLACFGTPLALVTCRAIRRRIAEGHS